MWKISREEKQFRENFAPKESVHHSGRQHVGWQKQYCRYEITNCFALNSCQRLALYNLSGREVRSE